VLRNSSISDIKTIVERNSEGWGWIFHPTKNSVIDLEFDNLLYLYRYFKSTTNF
jgi:hypothetical protein